MHTTLFLILVCCVVCSQVALTCTVDVMDLLGIYLCLTKFTSRSEQSTGIIKVLSTVVGKYWLRWKLGDERGGGKGWKKRESKGS